jgi:hypothetical protein
VSASTATFPFPGGTPSVSSLGNINGIVWIKELRNRQVILHAYDATNLAIELYSSAGVGTWSERLIFLETSFRNCSGEIKTPVRCGRGG